MSNELVLVTLTFNTISPGLRGTGISNPILLTPVRKTLLCRPNEHCYVFKIALLV